MSVVVILNPIAGARGGSAQTTGDRVALATRVLRDAGVPHRVEVTTGVLHASVLARDAVRQQASLVCAWGGDGTVNEVAAALAFTPTALGIIPGGSGNGLARAIGMSLRPEQALRQLIHGAEHPIDVGEIGGRLFVNVAGIGFDAYVAQTFNARGLKRGPMAYARVTAVELFRYQPLSYVIGDGEGETNGHAPGGVSGHEAANGAQPALMVVLANSPQYGNGAVIAPKARVDDGMLDLVVVEPRHPLASLWRARHLFTGTLATADGVSMRTVDRATVSVAEGPLWFHVDGEPVHAASSVSIRVHASALRVRVP